MPRNMSRKNVHIGDGGTTAILQHGVFFFNALKLFQAFFFYRASFEIKCLKIALVVSFVECDRQVVGSA
ncbi:hypothetical protein V5799_031080 [Amblyomma americanum]|uniref:Uncharacterized protein n=1 Tax=Amblyomma americanum TaxID=6943 RepID=A0AAQ4ELC5_AMBAM